MAIIQKKTSKGPSYLVRVRDASGEWFESKTFPTKADARDYEAELLALKRKGTKARSRNDRSRLVSDFWIEWDKNRTGVTDGWLLSQRQMWRDHVAPIIGIKKLIEVESKDILRVLASAKENKLGPQMQLHIYRMLHQLFDDALELYDYISSNPVRRKMRPTVPKTSREFFKPDEARKFLESIKGEWLATGIWVMTHCALRIGEIQALQWWEIDFETETITLTKQWRRKEKRIASLKNGQPVRIPMTAELKNYLLEKKPRSADPNDFVQPSQTGGMLSYDTFEDGLKRLCKKYEFRELSPHELRHTATELWFEAGASQEDVRRLLNHSSESAIQGYIHKTPERLSRIAKRMTGQAAPLKLVKSE